MKSKKVQNKYDYLLISSFHKPDDFQYHMSSQPLCKTMHLNFNTQ